MISQKLHLFQSKFPKNFNFFRQFHKKLRFSEKKIPNISIFSGNFTKNFYFLGHFTKSFDFLRKFAKHFYFFRQFKKNRFFQGKFPKNFECLGNFTKNFDFPGINWLFVAISGQIILFLFKSHHFLTYLLYIVRYNNILSPVHDPHNPPRPPCPKSGRVATPKPPRIDAYVSRRPQTKGKMRGIHAIRIFYSASLSPLLLRGAPE